MNYLPSKQFAFAQSQTSPNGTASQNIYMGYLFMYLFSLHNSVIKPWLHQER